MSEQEKQIKEKTMRDSFFDKLYDIAKQDRDVIIVSADMGAPSLDKFRKNLASQFVNVGIAEENMVAVAAGLAFEGKKVFGFAIAPFATSRCYEFIKIDCSLMNIPVNIVGCGAGFSYDDSGPTHHTTEDISIMRALPNLQILSPSDSIMAAAFAERAYKSNFPTYIRLDRKILPRLYDENETFERGFKELREGKDYCIVATGNMVNNALEASAKLEQVGVIDFYRLKPIAEELKNYLAKYKKIFSLEEHLLEGGMGSILSEIITDNELDVKLKRIGLDRYLYAYGGRENIQKITGIDVDSVVKEIENQEK